MKRHVVKLILFNRPFNELSQCTENSSHAAGRQTLSDFIDIPEIYAAGRLDKDRESLILMNNNAAVQAKISNPY